MMDAPRNGRIGESADEVLENAPCGFVSTLPDGTIIRANEQFRAWSGHGGDELLAGIRFPDLLTRPGQIYYQTHIEPLLLMQGFVREIACHVSRENHAPLPVLVNFALKSDEAGMPLLIRITVFDATDRTKYEHDLRQARRNSEQLAAIVASSKDAIVSIGLDLAVRSWNLGATLLFGYSETEAVGQNLDALIVPDHRREERARLAQKALSGNPATASRTVRRRKDGSLVPVEVGVSPIFDKDGNVSAVSAIYRDITEREHVEEALRHSEQLHRIAFDLAPAGIAYVGLNERFTKVNAAMCEISGYSADELTGMKAADLTHPGDRARDAEILAPFLSGTTSRYENEKRYVRKDGGIRRVTVAARMVTGRGDRPLHRVCVIRDISEQKIAEEKIRTSEIRYRRLFEAAHDGVLLIDPATRAIVDANPFMTSLLGYAHEALIGKELFEIGLLKDEAESQEMFLTLRRTHQVRYENLPLVSQTGRHQDVEVVANLYEEDGRSIIQCNIRDITERKLAVDALRESEAKLHLGASVAGLGLGTVDYLKDDITFDETAAGILDLPANTPIPRDEVRSHFHPDDAENIGARVAEGLDPSDDGFLAIDHRIIRSDGSVRWVGARRQVEFGLNAAGMKVPTTGLLALIDITEQIDTARSLQDSEARFDVAFHDSSAAMYVMSETGPKFLDVNRAGLALFGLSRVEMIGRTAAELALYADPGQIGIIHELRNRDGYLHDFEVGWLRKDGEIRTHLLNADRIALNGQACFFVVSHDITERKRTEEHNILLIAEVNHRAKNLLSVVQAVARQTARGGDPATFVTRLSERIDGLAVCQDLLVKNQWRGVEVSELVEAQLAHFRDLIGTRLLLDGPPVRVTPAAAQGIGMALHELATNAAKYGALSNREGRVRIAWKVDELAGAMFTMSWLEESGPKVTPPARPGFGQMVIGRMVEAAVDGTAEIEYRETGFSWRLGASAANILEGGRVTPSL